MPEPLTLDQVDHNRRWAEVARRTHRLGPGTTARVNTAIRSAIATRPLDAAEACLDELEHLVGEPDPLEPAP